jgi:hypothetical protein
MEQLSQTPFFPVPVRWFEIPMPKVPSVLGQLQDSMAADRSVAATTKMKRDTVPEADLSLPETSSPVPDSPTVGVLLNARA